MISILKVIYYFCLTLLKTDKTVFRNLSIRRCKISFRTRISMESSFTKTKVKLELLIDIDMLLMVQKGIRSRTCPSINRYVNDDNKYMKDYDKKKELSVLKY